MFGVSFPQAAGSLFFFLLVSASSGEAASVACVGFWVRGAHACVLVGGAGSCSSDEQATSGGVFWGVCELSMTLGSLSTKGWV